MSQFFAETDRDQAHARWREVADNLRDQVRDAAKLMDEGDHDVLGTNVVGILPNREAVIRLVGALMLEQTGE